MPDQLENRVDATIQRPVSIAELAALVSAATASGSAMRIRGGRTHEPFGNVGEHVDLDVETTGLNRVIDYSPVDLTLAVEAGVRVAEIDSLLAEHSQRLAIDVPARDQATIGGTFASGLSGPRRLRYGSLKDMVIGAEVVTSSGDISKSGGMVVKNVSGYELARLHYGAHGAYGAVSRLNLKVLPVVESRVEVRCAFTNAVDCMTAAAAILVSFRDPAAVYSVRNRPGAWALHVQIEGNERFTRLQREAVVEHIAGVIKPAGVEMIVLEGNSTPVFDGIASLVDSDGMLIARLSVPASSQSDVLKRLPDVSNIAILADAGSGLVYVRTDATTEAVDLISGLGVPMTCLSIPDSFKADFDVFGSMDANGLKIVERLKDEYDPGRIFNPGRFVNFL